MPRLANLALGLALVLGLVARPAAARQDVPHAEPGTAAELAADATHDQAEAQDEKSQLLAPQLPLAVYTLIVFGLLLALLYRFAWGPLTEALHAREHRLQHAFDEAQRARSEAAALLEQHRQQMAQAHNQVRALIDEARRDAQATADEIVRKAQAEAEASKQRAHREIGTAKDEALMEIWSRSADLAVGVAQRVLARELGPEDHRRLVARATEQLAAARAGHPGGGDGA